MAGPQTRRAHRDAADGNRSAVGLDRAAQTARKLSRSPDRYAPGRGPTAAFTSSHTVGTFRRWDCINAGQRKRSRAPVRSRHVPLSRPQPPQTAAKLRGFSPTAPGFTAETDSPLEGAGFEPSVPLYGELGALGRVRRTRAAIVKPGTPDRSRRRARRPICGTPG